MAHALGMPRALVTLLFMGPTVRCQISRAALDSKGIALVMVRALIRRLISGGRVQVACRTCGRGKSRLDTSSGAMLHQLANTPLAGV